MAASFFIGTVGIAESSKYPYTAKTGLCKKKILPSYLLPNFAYKFIDGDEEKLKAMLIRFGPLPVMIGEKYQ